MAYRFELDESSRILLCRLSGSVSWRNVDQFYRDTGAQIERTAPRAVIFDFTDVASFEVSTDFVRTMADAPPLVPDTACPRLVVAPSQHIFGMSRMFQMRGERSRPNLQVVRSLQDALAMIGVKSAEFKPVADE